MIDALPVAAVVMQSDGVLLDANPQAEALLVRARVDATNMLDVVHSDDHALLGSLLVSTPGNDGTYGPSVIRLFDAQRQLRGVQAWAAPVEIAGIGTAHVLVLTEESVRDGLARAYAEIAAGRPLVESLRTVAAAVSGAPLFGRAAVLRVVRAGSVGEHSFDVIGRWPHGRSLVETPGSPWRRAVFEKLPVICLDPDDRRIPAEVRGAMRTSGLDSVASLPIVGNDGTIFAVLVTWRSAAVPNANDDRHFGDLVDAAAIAFERAKYDAQRIEAPARDPLTGAASKAALQARVQADASSVGALFVDVDHFHTVNSAYGRRFGDELLREVTQRLARSVRTIDAIYRAAGDTFVVVCETDSSTEQPATRTVGALAERIVQAFGLPITLGEHLLSISVSVGAAVGRGALDDTVSAAEAALFIAKQTGRGNWHLVEVPDEGGRANARE